MPRQRAKLRWHGSRAALREHMLAKPPDWKSLKKLNKKQLRRQRKKHRENRRLDVSDYQRYLLSDHWKKTRAAAIKRADGKCQQCGSTQELQVHHVRYDSLGHEKPCDLHVVCRRCHLCIHVAKITGLTFHEVSKRFTTKQLELIVRKAKEGNFNAEFTKQALAKG